MTFNNIPDLVEIKKQLNVNDEAIDFLRDEGLKIEKTNPELALSLMSIGLAFRPKGLVLKNKVAELLERLGNSN